EADVERRPVPLDQVLLEMQRLDLGVGDDHLDVGDAVRQLRDRRARVGARLEVAANAWAELLRLADVQDLPALVSEEVDTRLRGKRLELVFEVRHCGSKGSLRPGEEGPGRRGNRGSRPGRRDRRRG